MTLLMNNVKPRKTLATQLDRLDRILDGLADNLNGAVAESVKDAVAAAVKEAVKEVLTNPALQQRMQDAQNAAMPAQPKKPLVRRVGNAMAGLWSRTKAVAKAGCKQAIAVANASYIRARAGVANTRVIAQAKVRAAVKRVRLAVPVLIFLAHRAKNLAWQYRKPVLLAAGVGAVIGLCCYFAGPWTAALAAGMSCGGVAAAASEWLPRFERLIPQRRMMAEPSKK